MVEILLITFPDADFKFYITANLNTRAKRRYRELKGLKKKVIKRS